MQSLKRDFVAISAVSALAFAIALAWGHPFVGAHAARVQNHPQQQIQPGDAQAKAATFTGTVVRNGDTYALRDSSGAIYGLDNSERVRPFEGQSVTVTGQLNSQAKVIHVAAIEGADA
jgi:hypothetical protein